MRPRTLVSPSRISPEPVIELAKGWIEEIQANTIEPAPESETSRGGRLSLEYGRLEAGERLTVWMQFEANPNAAGRRDASIRLLDDDKPVAAIDLDVTIYP